MKRLFILFLLFNFFSSSYAMQQKGKGSGETSGQHKEKSGKKSSRHRRKKHPKSRRRMFRDALRTHMALEALDKVEELNREGDIFFDISDFYTMFTTVELRDVPLNTIGDLEKATNTKLLPWERTKFERSKALCRLRTIVLTNCLERFPVEVIPLRSLRSLFLGNNDLGSLPPEVGDLIQLYELHINGCQVTHVPPEIGKLTRLKVLDLGDNNLEELPQEIGNLTRLRELNLRSNPLQELPEGLENLPELDDESREAIIRLREKLAVPSSSAEEDD